ncbi:Cell number regulator 10-like protein [Drosera capensis]
MTPVTGVPVNKGYVPPQQPGVEGKWSTGLLDCCSDVPHCCLTCWCPCITFGRIAEIVNRGTTSCGVSGALYSVLCCLVGCQWVYTCTYRSKLRQQYGLPAGNCNDCCTHFWCEPCALCQEYRELQNRGFEPSLGWEGNLEKLTRGVAMVNPPVVQTGMSK